MMQAGQSCSTCRFANQISYDRCECRRHAPQVLAIMIVTHEPSGDHLTGWPEMRGSDWCGDWQSAMKAPDTAES